MKKIIPFGSKLKQQIDHLIFPKNDVYLFIGSKSWRRAKNWSKQHDFVLCLPPYENPENYEFPVCNCDILIIDTSYVFQHEVEHLASILFSYNAKIVRYSSTDNKLTIYKKDF